MAALTRYKFTATGFPTSDPYTPATATGHIVAETQAEAQRMVREEGEKRGVVLYSVLLERV